jgi:hypothetical protein
MEPEQWLPCSQESAIGFYPERHGSTRYVIFKRKISYYFSTVTDKPRCILLALLWIITGFFEFWL